MDRGWAGECNKEKNGCFLVFARSKAAKGAIAIMAGAGQLPGAGPSPLDERQEAAWEGWEGWRAWQARHRYDFRKMW